MDQNRVTQFLSRFIQNNSNDVCNYNAFLALFGVLIVNWFRDVEDVNEMDEERLERIARLSIIASTIGNRVWTNVSRIRTQERGERRAA